mgnify:CR=1 FL=1
MHAGLACFRDGALAGSAILDTFTDEEAGLLEERVTLWLQQQRVLRQEGAKAVAAGEAAAAARDDSSDEVGLRVSMVKAAFSESHCKRFCVLGWQGRW